MQWRLRRATRNATAWSHAIAQQLLTRYGVVFRETAHAENLPGGFSAVYDVLKAMEESGRVRRGYFAADLGATQFAMPAAVDLLRTLRRRVQDEERSEVVMLAATDPANPYGALLRWPAAPEEGASLTRSVGARVVLVDGALVLYLRRGNANVQVMLPEEEPARSQAATGAGGVSGAQVQRREDPEGVRGAAGMLIATVNGVAVAEHPLARFLLDAGFQAAPMGFNVRRNLPPLLRRSAASADAKDEAGRCLRATQSIARRGRCTRRLAGKTVTAFETGLREAGECRMMTAPLVGRTVERVEARGKWCLIFFSGDLDSGDAYVDERDRGTSIGTGEKWLDGRKPDAGC